MQTREFIEMFRGSYKNEFKEAADYSQFCGMVALRNKGLAKVLAEYKWVPKLFLTEKAHPGHQLMVPLEKPAIKRFDELFSRAMLVDHSKFNQRKGPPVIVHPFEHEVVNPLDKDVIFITGQRGEAPHGHFGGERYITQYPDGSVVRGHKKCRWMCTYVMPKDPQLSDHYASIEVIKREDGFLVIGGTKGAFKFRDWLALVDLDDDFEKLLSAEDRQFLTTERMADELAWGSIVPGEDRGEFLAPGVLPGCKVIQHVPWKR